MTVDEQVEYMMQTWWALALHTHMRSFFSAPSMFARTMHARVGWLASRLIQAYDLTLGLDVKVYDRCDPAFLELSKPAFFQTSLLSDDEYPSELRTPLSESVVAVPGGLHDCLREQVAAAISIPTSAAVAAVEQAVADLRRQLADAA